jgi:hypothetical protein
MSYICCIQNYDYCLQVECEYFIDCIKKEINGLSDHFLSVSGITYEFLNGDHPPPVDSEWVS